MSENEKKLIEKLAKSENRFRDFFENAPEGIAILDVETGKFVQCNTNALRLLQLTGEQFLTSGPTDLSPEFQPGGERSSDKAARYIERALAGEKMVFEWVAMKGNAEVFNCEVRLVLMTDSEKPLLYASFVDITDRKETEAQIREQNMRLAEIAFMQSHQLRQPVATLLGLINLINLKNPTDPRNIELIKQLKKATKLSDNILKKIVKHTAIRAHL